MNAPRQNQQEPKQNKESMLVRGFHDLGTPQGASLFGIIILCGIIAIILDYIGERYHLPKSLIYTIIIIFIVAVFIYVVFRMSMMNKKAIEKRRETYRRKYGGKS